MKKIILASAATLIAALSFASTSEAGYRWHHHNHFPGSIDLVVNGPSYYDDDYGYDDDACYFKKIRKVNRWGEVVIKRVQICD